MNEFRCFYCGEEVDPSSTRVWHRVVGWERRAGVRASGSHGGSDIALREAVPGELAHDHCIRLVKTGVSPRQGSLV